VATRGIVAKYGVGLRLNGNVLEVDGSTLAGAGVVPNTRSIATTGPGLTGGGALNTDRTFALGFDTALPAALGAAAVGTSGYPARHDHVHATTGLALLAGAAFTGAVSTTGNLSAGGTLGVTGATTLSSTLGVTGVLTATGGLTVATTKSVAGAMELTLASAAGQPVDVKINTTLALRVGSDGGVLVGTTTALGDVGLGLANNKAVWGELSGSWLRMLRMNSGGVVELSETGADTDIYGGAIELIPGTDGLSLLQSWMQFDEISDPGAVANKARLFAKDNGGGKTLLCVRFGSGAVQVLATEP
jgi:hypothetical protein